MDRWYLIPMEWGTGPRARGQSAKYIGNDARGRTDIPGTEYDEYHAIPMACPVGVDTVKVSGRLPISASQACSVSMPFFPFFTSRSSTSRPDLPQSTPTLSSGCVFHHCRIIALSTVLQSFHFTFGTFFPATTGKTCQPLRAQARAASSLLE